MALPSNLIVINGHDWTPYVLSAGLEWARNDLDDESAGRTLDGKMHRKRITNKRTLTLKFRRLPADKMKLLCSDVSPETFTISYPSPEVFAPGDTPPVYKSNMKVYGTTVNGTLVLGDALNDTMYWEGVSFQLTEV